MSMTKIIKNYWIIIVGLAMMSCAAKSTEVAADLQIVEAEVRIYEVFGMDCPGCHGGLEKQLNAIDGVLDSEADWTNKQVKVIVDPNKNVSDDSIFAGMKRANFTPGKRLQ